MPGVSSIAYAFGKKEVFKFWEKAYLQQKTTSKLD
jgi:hypothetical protein